VPVYYSNDNESDKNIKSYCTSVYAGIASEWFFLNNKIGISTGLRFTSLNCIANKDGMGSSSSFYLLYQQNGLNTDYLRIKEISQQSEYLGIPLDFKFFVFRNELSKFYIKTCVVFNVKLQTKTKISFYDPSMDSYSGNVSGMVGSPNSFSLGFNLSGGYQLVLPHSPVVNLECSLPSAILTREKKGLLDPISGAGIQISVMLPLKNKAQ
jgi:Galactokinase